MGRVYKRTRSTFNDIINDHSVFRHWLKKVADYMVRPENVAVVVRCFGATNLDQLDGIMKESGLIHIRDGMEATWLHPCQDDCEYSSR